MHGARQFGGSIPTLDAIPPFDNGDVFIGIGVLDVFGHLSTSHCHVQVMAFEVQSEDGTVFFLHQRSAGIGSLFDHGNRGRRQGGKNAGSAVAHVGADGCAERIFCALHKVAASSAMCMDLYAAGQDIHALDIDQLCADDG